MITRLVHNVETGEISEVSVDEKEIELNALQKEKFAQAQAEAQAKRQALLDKLGITEEEAKLLLGGN